MQINASSWASSLGLIVGMSMALYLANLFNPTYLQQLYGLVDIVVYETNKEAVSFSEGVSSYFVNKKKFESMRQELRNTKKKLAHYKLLSKESTLLRQENRKLKEAIHHQVRQESHILLAPPYFIQQDSKQSLLLPRSGVPCKQGDLVIEQGNLVGQITLLTNKTIRVQMITDKESAIPVTIKGTDIHGFLHGQGAGAMKIKFIKDSAAVRVGDKVQTKKIQGMSEKSYNVGEVVRVEKIPGDGFLMIDVEPSFHVHYESWLALAP